MKHLKKFENSEFNDISDIIKDIILPLRDDYNNVEGEIRLLQDNSILLEIKPNKINFRGDKYSIERAEHIQEFVNEILEASKRIKEATGKVVKILNIYDSLSLSNEAMLSSDPIKIYIIDISSSRDKLLSK